MNVNNSYNKQQSQVDFVVVGAGINGLVIAYELAKQGVSVTLLDRRDAGKEASWAGGGLLCPLGPWRYSDWVQRVAAESQQYYPKWLDRLKEHTEIDPELVCSGMVMVNVASEPGFDKWSERQTSIIPLNRRKLEVLAYEAEAFADGYWLPDVNQVRNPRLISALLDALSRLGVNIVQWCEVRDFISSKSRIEGVVTSNGNIFAGSTVVTAGAWSRNLLLKIGVEVLVEPMLGQMLRIVGPHQFTAVLMEERKYLIPRLDGSVVLGSTSEDTGFNKICAAQTQLELIEWASRWWRGLSSDWVSHHWCGLRPASPGGKPFVGRAPQYENVWISTGHFRNGLLMGPLMANRLVVDMLKCERHRVASLAQSTALTLVHK